MLNRLGWLRGLASVSFVLALSARGHAFCLTHTCNDKKQKCEYLNGCIVSGKPLFWASSQVTWSAQKDGSALEGVSADALETVIGRAFATWEAADCNGKHPSIHLKNRGQVACGKAEYNSDEPNANVIAFRDKDWPYGADSAVGTLAITTVFFNTDTGEIYDANVEINSFRHNFAIGTDPNGRYDLNAVLTHELGHFLGLSHNLTDFSATMATAYAPDMVTLEADDIAGICASLPPDRTPRDSSEPRHGFSGDCGTPNSGCCSSTIGGHTPARQTLGAWVFGLGLALWGARRFRRSPKAPALPR